MEQVTLKVAYRTGDLVEMFKNNEMDVIVHGCNCQVSMAGGIAKQIAEEYPQAVRADKVADELYGRDYRDLKLGKWSVAEVFKYGKSRSKSKHIINLYTQIQPGAEFDINALKSGLMALNQAEGFRRGGMIKRFFVKKRVLGIPEIGCGIGGGDWNQVEKVIEDSLDQFKVVVVSRPI